MGQADHTTPDASDNEFLVHQHGPRRLWDEVETAHQRWLNHGKPSIDHWQFTVTPNSHKIELD